MGVVAGLKKVVANTVCGIDASTNSLAWAIFDNGKPVNCGEIKFKGATPFERLKDAKWKVRALVNAGVLKADYVAIESAIMVRNIQTAIDLAYVYGAIMGELMQLNPQVAKIAPISWQSGIGNKNFTKAEKEQVQAEFPGKSKTWYQNKVRELRKQRTMDIARKHFKIPTGSDNISDAVGIALYFSKTLTAEGKK